MELNVRNCLIPAILVFFSNEASIISPIGKKSNVVPVQRAWMTEAWPRIKNRYINTLWIPGDECYKPSFLVDIINFLCFKTIKRVDAPDVHSLP
jgi:hypothetical protein